MTGQNASSDEGRADPRFPKIAADFVSHGVLGAERKQVTILFADIRGSLRLISEIDPEEARNLLAPALAEMIDAVHEYAGFVSRVLGDGIMALFGAPYAQEGHALRACYAALRMLEKLQSGAAAKAQPRPPRLQVRIGLHSGEVVVGAMKNDLSINYDATGAVVHLASRLEKLARPGTAVISGDTAKLVEGEAVVEAIGPVAIKGLQRPIAAYRLIGIGSSPDRTRLRQLLDDDFVGRDAELSTLEAVVNSARNGRGRFVAVAGEPGVGKSRLFTEFIARTESEATLIIRAATERYGRTKPFLTVIKILNSLFEFQEFEPAASRREKVLRRLEKAKLEVDLYGTAIFALLDLGPPDPGWTELYPGTRRQRTFDALKALVAYESERRLLILVIEDLQWIDTETHAFLDELFDVLAERRIVVLANFRPEYNHQWGSRRSYQQIWLERFARPEAEALVGRMIGSGIDLAAIRHRLVDWTEGNPFFMEEAVQSLVHSEILVGRRGAYRVAREVEDLRPPASVHSLLAQRIDSLPAGHKRILLACAVIGGDFSQELLQAICDQPEESVAGALKSLETGEFIRVKRVVPAPEYAFKHALTQEVAYRSLLTEQRQALHARIVEAIERNGAHLVERVEFVADHAIRGAAWAKAADYSRLAGEKALEHSASRQAMQHFENALVALDHREETKATIATKIDVMMGLRAALTPLLELKRIEQYLDEAERLAAAIDDHARLARIAAYRAGFFYTSCALKRALKSGREAKSLALATEKPDLHVVANVYLGQTYHALGNYRRSILVLRENLRVLRGDAATQHFGLPGVASVMTHAWIARSHAELGSFTPALAHAHKAVAVVDALPRPFDVVYARASLGFVHLVRGDVPSAVENLEVALDTCRREGIRFMLPVAASHLGYAYALTGRGADGMPLLEEAVDEMEALGIRAAMSRWHTRLGEGALLVGHLDLARRSARRALDMARENGELGYEAYARALMANIEFEQLSTDRRRAVKQLREALALAQRLQMRPLGARCWLDLAKCCAAIGDAKAARQAAQKAKGAFEKMRMRRWPTEASPGSFRWRNAARKPRSDEAGPDWRH